MSESQLAPRKPQRPWFVLRLRTVMLLILPVAAGLGWKANRAHIQTPAVERIEKAGGLVTYDYTFSGEYPDKLDQAAWFPQKVGDAYFQSAGPTDPLLPPEPPTPPPVVAAAPVLALALPADDEASARQEPGGALRCSGRVFDRSTFTPIAGATVSVRRFVFPDPETGWKRVLQETSHPTDNEGKYHFRVPPSRWPSPGWPSLSTWSTRTIRPRIVLTMGLATSPCTCGSATRPHSTSRSRRASR